MLEHSCKLADVGICNDGVDQRDGTVVEIRETGRLWGSERWDGCGDKRDGTVVEIREMEGCGDKRDGRLWR